MTETAINEISKTEKLKRLEASLERQMKIGGNASEVSEERKKIIQDIKDEIEALQNSNEDFND